MAADPRRTLGDYTYLALLVVVVALKNGERKLEEQERRNLEHSARAPTHRRGNSRLGIQSSSPGISHPRLGVPSPPQGQAIHA
ncbi:hypothetical protein PIB30_065348 [Stylosanthes scabra]|uniref:Uncharacterized protein n=1 Tax=Stylosanthes scabra TaxID=79078 RepID=A0ABU6ULI9_9FABA|nr:hypothetical protein [Stylosanthes scabra]